MHDRLYTLLFAHREKISPPSYRKGEVLAKLREVARRLVWTFYDEHHGDQVCIYGPGPQGLTTRPADDEHWFVSITLHVSPLRVLLNQKATPAERNIARFNFASVVSSALTISWL